MSSVAVRTSAAVVITLLATTGCAVGEGLDEGALVSAAQREQLLAAASQAAMGGMGPTNNLLDLPTRDPNAPPPDDTSPSAMEPATEETPGPNMNGGAPSTGAGSGGSPSASNGGMEPQAGTGGGAPDVDEQAGAPGAGGEMGLPEEPEEPEPEPEPDPPTMPTATQPFPTPGTGGQGPTGEDTSLIDDMEDGDDQVSSVAGRDGTWFTFNDGGGTQTFEMDTSCNRAPPTSVGCAHSEATTFPEYAGFGLSLRDGDLPVDASMYEGVRFYARNGVPGSVVVSILTASSNSASGSPGFEATIQTNSTWREVEVGFDEVELAAWYTGAAVTFDSGELVKVQFYTPSGASHDLSIDDIEFY